MYFLKLSGIHFSFGNETIFENFSIELQESEKLVLKGESGSGKSTLIKLFLGFLQPDDGKILECGQPMNTDAFRKLRKRSAWLPQDLNMGENRVKEMINIPFSFKQNDGSKPSENTILYTFDQLGLQENVLDKQFKDLSTGQRQRVGITICLLLNRPLLLLDEPTSALDQSSKVKAAELLLGNPDKTVFSVSHDPLWIERCERVIEI